MDAETLLEPLKRVMDGLIDKGIRVISYASDGTEVERAVQRLFLDQTSKREVKIPNPRPGCGSTIIVFGFYRGQAICMIQDSKHALKTLRNNLFSGARFLVFGNFTAMYKHILEIASGSGTPLYTRDVIKLDRQDDNAATRLFSSHTLKYLADHHPEHVGVIVYLFVFGDLVDAYQNRSMDHHERIKLVLRARYFLDSWEKYLTRCNYRKDHYFISREASDILRMIIEGLIALIIIHRDYLPQSTPLLPWLHSTESCEHVFGDGRKVVKDFTYLDFIYMIPKLRISLHQAALRGKSSDPKARAAGYTHTYFDHEGLDLEALSTFPTDAEIGEIAKAASEEADSLVALLGVDADLLWHSLGGPTPATWLPSISSWLNAEDEAALFDDRMDESEQGDDDDNSDDDDGALDRLQVFLDAEEDSPMTRTQKVDKKCLSLTSAALALATDDAAIV